MARRSASAGPGDQPAAGDLPGNLPTSPEEIKNMLEDILNLPGNALDNLGLGEHGKKRQGRS